MLSVCLSVCLQEFVYDRFTNGAQFYKAGELLKHPIMAFGSLCPGKRYALLQLKWFLLTVLTRYDLRYAAVTSSVTSSSCRLPSYDARYHGHEVLPPVCDVDVQFRLKPNSRRLQLSAGDDD